MTSHHLCCTLLVTNKSLGLVHPQMEGFHKGCYYHKEGIIGGYLRHLPTTTSIILLHCHYCLPWIKKKKTTSHLPLVNFLQTLSPQKPNLRRKYIPLKCLSIHLELRDSDLTSLILVLYLSSLSYWCPQPYLTMSYFSPALLRWKLIYVKERFFAFES